MLYEKKIEEAARVYILSKKVNETAYLLLRSIDDFKAGAHWAIEQFLKELWHDDSEEPRNKASVLVIGGDKDHIIYYLESDYQDWNHEVELWEINKWCYLDDLLEQKGGSNG